MCMLLFLVYSNFSFGCYILLCEKKTPEWFSKYSYSIQTCLWVVWCICDSQTLGCPILQMLFWFVYVFGVYDHTCAPIHLVITHADKTCTNMWCIWPFTLNLWPQNRIAPSNLLSQTYHITIFLSLPLRVY